MTVEADRLGCRSTLRYAVATWRLCWQAGSTLAMTALALTIIVGILSPTAAWLTRLLLNNVTGHGRGLSPLLIVGFIAIVGLCAAATPRLADYVKGELGRRLDLQLQENLYSSVNKLNSLSWFENPTFLNRLRTAAQATGPVLEPATTGWFRIGQDLISLVGLIGSLAVLSPGIAAIVVVAGIPALLAQLSLSRQQIAMIAGTSAPFRRRMFYSVLLTDVRAAKEIRLLGIGGFLTKRMHGEFRKIHDRQRIVDKRTVSIQCILGLLSAVVAGAGLAWAVQQAKTGRFTVGDISLFIAAIAGVQAAVGNLVNSLGSAHKALAMYRYLDEILAVQEVAPQRPIESTSSPVPCGIALHDVWFRYDSDHPWVLRGVTLQIPAKTATALVGLNGAGKSTIVKLLCRFYEPTRGSITWDGVDIREIPIADLRSRVAVLFQDFMTFDLTARENIGLGDLPRIVDTEVIHRAAESAEIHNVLAGLPRGYETMLTRMFAGDDDDSDDVGVTLSGGQWQRVALARSFMRSDRDLVILDEPSAGLDADAEQAIHTRLRTWRTGQTSLLISHRLNTIRDADTIFVLADGRIVETGTHFELIARNGEYARLFTLQAEGYQQEEAEFPA